ISATATLARMTTIRATSKARPAKVSCPNTTQKLRWRQPSVLNGSGEWKPFIGQFCAGGGERGRRREMSWHRACTDRAGRRVARPTNPAGRESAQAKEDDMSTREAYLDKMKASSTNGTPRSTGSR